MALIYATQKVNYISKKRRVARRSYTTDNRLVSYLYILVLYEHRKTCEMVCFTNCSCGARLSCYHFNTIICPQAVVYQKGKIISQNFTVSQLCKL